MNFWLQASNTCSFFWLNIFCYEQGKEYISESTATATVFTTGDKHFTKRL